MKLRDALNRRETPPIIYVQSGSVLSTHLTPLSMLLDIGEAIHLRPIFEAPRRADSFERGHDCHRVHISKPYYGIKRCFAVIIERTRP